MPTRCADLSIGVRDGMLLDLRELLFGRTIVGLIECPACGDTLETEVATGDLRATPLHELPQVSRSNYDLSLHLLDSRDQIAAERARPEERRPPASRTLHRFGKSFRQADAGRASCPRR